MKSVSVTSKSMSMKRISYMALLVLTVLSLAACRQKTDDAGVDIIHNPQSAGGYDNKEAMPAISFDSDVHDFGRLSAGESVSYSFHFRNTGNADLILSGASATCGCTVADYPGGEGYVTVTFKSAGKSGQQFQEVTLVCNAQPSRIKLKILAQVAH